MEWFSAPEYWLARLVFLRLLGVVYLVAFLSALNQFRPLVGARGLLPAPPYLRTVGFRRAPSIFHLRYSDRLAATAAWAGVLLATAAVVGLVEQAPLWGAMAAWAAMWVLYMSFVNAGQIFFGFVWETLLLEAGFLAIFLGNSDTAPPIVVVLLVRWLLFRLEVGAGLIKVRRDRAWRDLTALCYHHETQPIPNRLSWRFHHLPKGVHKVEAAGNHLAQLVIPFALFGPQPMASVAGAAVVATQLWLMASGNFAWLNLLTVTLAVVSFDNDALGPLLPVDPPGAQAAGPGWFQAVTLAMAAAVVLMSHRPVRNMVSRDQVMNRSYNPLHLVNTYGLFGHITRERPEVVIEGTDEPEPSADTVWRPYEFKAKPGDVSRPPRQVAPYHLRLDWLMWFAALSPGYAESWFVTFVARLLENDPATTRLLRTNPFADQPPTFVRANLYLYRFTTRAERREKGEWWRRELVGEYLPPVTLTRPTSQPAMR